MNGAALLDSVDYHERLELDRIAGYRLVLRADFRSWNLVIVNGSTPLDSVGNQGRFTILSPILGVGRAASQAPPFFTNVIDLRMERTSRPAIVEENFGTEKLALVRYGSGLLICAGGSRTVLKRQKCIALGLRHGTTCL